MYTIHRDYNSDGVLGLNGGEYLLDENNKVLTFASVEDAVQFLTDNDIDIDRDEYMHIVNEGEADE